MQIHHQGTEDSLLMMDRKRITFRRITADDRARLLAMVASIWGGHDYLPAVFDRWVGERDSYFAGMLLDGQLVGCGRLLPFDGRRGWLETLRVDPQHQGQGLGRLMAEHMIRTGLERGYKELAFSTYFDNQSSIAINEAFGFRRIAVYTNLDLLLTGERRSPDASVPPAGEADPAGLLPPVAPAAADPMTSRPGIPDADAVFWNDWLFVPPGLADRERYFPRARTLAGLGCTLFLSDNTKSPGMLEISWLEAPGGELPAACLTAVVNAAREQRYEGVHTMLPAAISARTFLEAGFTFFEQEGDVYLYAGLEDEIRL